MLKYNIKKKKKTKIEIEHEKMYLDLCIINENIFFKWNKVNRRSKLNRNHGTQTHINIEIELSKHIGSIYAYKRHIFILMPIKNQ